MLAAGITDGPDTVLWSPGEEGPERRRTCISDCGSFLGFVYLLYPSTRGLFYRLWSASSRQGICLGCGRVAGLWASSGPLQGLFSCETYPHINPESSMFSHTRYCIYSNTCALSIPFNEDPRHPRHHPRHWGGKENQQPGTRGSTLVEIWWTSPYFEWFNTEYRCRYCIV
jgi:hypothetical protein